MTDSISGIKNIVPTYPVSPTQPTQKDREAQWQRKKRHHSGTPERGPDKLDDDKPTIDEQV